MTLHFSDDEVHTIVPAIEVLCPGHDAFGFGIVWQPYGQNVQFSPILTMDGRLDNEPAREVPVQPQVQGHECLLYFCFRHQASTRPPNGQYPELISFC